eukprot:TRINITY_DN967_c0_g6_i1.p1 TRINITY_DN967_c0_g6~~TRINITY_DN967_c0_g6_i1.p1  ORF type:complete len:215 (+),score=29.06 TRINITY_DN967_c0_g6_i1:108-752(+)
MSTTKTLIFLLALCALTLADHNYYDRCNPAWVKIIQRGQLYDCAEPYSANPALQVASGVTAIGNLLNSYGIRINGREPTPIVVFEHFQGAFGYPDKLKKLFQELGLRYEVIKATSLKDKVDSALKSKDNRVIIINKGKRLELIHKGVDSLGYRYVASDRGQILGVEGKSFDEFREALIFTKLQSLQLRLLCCLFAQIEVGCFLDETVDLSCRFI